MRRPIRTLVALLILTLGCGGGNDVFRMYDRYTYGTLNVSMGAQRIEGFEGVEFHCFLSTGCDDEA